MVLLAPAAQAESRDHIRVVLDLSKSMVKNDPGQMAILSTLLLYDLANPSIGEGDSFKVIPFHPAWQWNDPAQPPPTDNAPVIAAEPRKRAQFVNAVNALAYNAQCTHFYPGLRAAIEDLESTGRTDDTRTIVLVTDGVPDNPCDPKAGKGTKAKEAGLIQQELVPRLAKKNIRLYVLAFGSEAVKNESFFKEMIGSAGSAPLGELFLAQDGARLLEGMLKLFGASLGYGVDDPKPLPQSSLKLSEGGELPRTAVVVFSPKAASPPTIRLNPPAGAASLNIQNGFPGEARPGAAYTLAWVLKPVDGVYGFSTDASHGHVAVLRPTRVKLDMRPYPPHTQADSVMADTELPLLLEASNEFGGAPGRDMVLKFRLHAPAIAWSKDNPDAPQEAAGIAPTATGGKVYTLSPRFPANPKNPAERYKGQIEAWASASKSGKPLGDLRPQHEVEVYPFLSITPSPAIENAGAALGRGDRHCANFKLELSGGSHLPEPGPYVLKAALNPANPAVAGLEFFQASFTLDGLPLRFLKASGSSGAPWDGGQALDRKRLLEDGHTLCVKIGRPKAGDPAKPIDLPLRFILAKSPYDDFDVIKPFTLRLSLATPPADFGRWPLWTALGLLALALLWYLRDRPALAPDLGYAIAPDTPQAKLVSRPFGANFGPARLLGLRVEQPIVPEPGGQPLAWLSPVDGELYQLRLARGVQLSAPGSEEPARSGIDGRLATVSVRHVYRLHGPGGVYRLRLEYR